MSMFKMEEEAGYKSEPLDEAKVQYQHSLEGCELKLCTCDERDGFWYLGSPYSKYPSGRLQAYIDIMKHMAICLKAGIKVFCPIVHTHYVSLTEPLTEQDKESYDFWLGLDKVFLDASIGLIVSKMESWDISHGLLWEIDYMTRANKPIIYTEWLEIPNVR